MAKNDPRQLNTPQSVNALVKSPCDVMRRSDGTAVMYNGHWRAVWNPSNSSISATSMEITLQ